MDNPVQYAVVDNAYMLPLDEAVGLLRLLSKAWRVSQTWSNEMPYKFSTDSTGSAGTLKLISTAQFAAMNLDRDG